MSAPRSLTATQVAAIKEDGVHWVAASLYLQVRPGQAIRGNLTRLGAPVVTRRLSSSVRGVVLGTPALWEATQLMAWFLGTADGTYTGHDTLANIESMNGSRGNDALSGDDGANGFAGNDGDDVINGRGGDDFINGEAGHDTLDGGAGNDYLVGGSEADTFVFTAHFGNDTIEDFHQGDADVIRFTGVFADYNDIIGHASDNSAGNVVIATDTGDSVELLGVDLAHLSSSDFIV